MKILAAEDQPIILKSIQYKLEQIGFEVVTASNGQIAIDEFDNHLPDLAIIDLDMPIKNGFEVISHIKNSKKPETPIIVISGDDEESSILRAFEQGADDYIEKPVGLNEVVARIKRLLKLPSTFNPSSSKVASSSGILRKNGIGVVIPCYNEELRLKTDEFAGFVKNNHGYVLCFVNDGSKDNTLQVLEDFKKGNDDSIQIYNCAKNGGKAEAVRLGMLYLLDDKSLDYIGFLDADLSTNFADFDDLAATIASHPEYKLVAGSRIARMGAKIIKQSSRGIISLLINRIIRKILGMEFQDTQCGAKIMTRDVIENTFQEPFTTRWLFDVEIFLRMKKRYGAAQVQSMICEQPLNRWVHEDGSKLSMKDSIEILKQLLVIGFKY